MTKSQLEVKITLDKMAIELKKDSLIKEIQNLKKYSRKFDIWKWEQRWDFDINRNRYYKHLTDGRNEYKTFPELFDMFIETLKQK